VCIEGDDYKGHQLFTKTVHPRKIVVTPCSSVMRVRWACILNPYVAMWWSLHMYTKHIEYRT